MNDHAPVKETDTKAATEYDKDYKMLYKLILIESGGTGYDFKYFWVWERKITNSRSAFTTE